MSGFFGPKEIDLEYIRPEIQALVKRRNVTLEELSNLRINSWERDALVPVMTNEALIDRAEYAVANCFVTRERPFCTYNQAVEGLFAPELIKRLKLEMEAAENMASVVEGVREAIGQKNTHYMIVASDVKELVKAIEKSDSIEECRAELVRIREHR